MSFYSGSDGQLIYAPADAAASSNGTLQDSNGSSVEKVLAKVRNWSFSSSTATLDTTTLGDTDRTFRHGIRSASGNATLFSYTTTTGSNVADLIQRQLGDPSDSDEEEPEKFTLKFLIGRGTANPYYLIGRCMITSLNITMNVGEICSANVAFDIDGPLVKFRL